MRIRSSLIALSGALLIPLVACAPAPPPLETRPDFTGFITGLQPGRITVESHADKLVDRYVLTLSPATTVFEEQAKGSLRPVSARSLAARQWVRIWFSGPVTGSWPKQAAARQIVIEAGAASTPNSPQQAPPEPTPPPAIID